MQSHYTPYFFFHMIQIPAAIAPLTSVIAAWMRIWISLAYTARLIQYWSSFPEISLASSDRFHATKKEIMWKMTTKIPMIHANIKLNILFLNIAKEKYLTLDFKLFFCFFFVFFSLFYFVFIHFLQKYKRFGQFKNLF